MSLLSTIKKVSEQKPNKFLAPIPSSETVSLFSLQQNIPYWFNLRKPESGWYWVEPISKNKADVSKEAQPHEYLNYLNQLPSCLCIVLFSLDRNTILVMPYNETWKNSEPKKVHLMRHNFRPLQVITARKMGDILLYDSIGYSSQAITLSSQAQLALSDKSLLVPKLFQSAYDVVLRKVEKDKVVQKQLTTEDKIKDKLSFVGADLLSWNENEDGYIVEYKYEGATFRIDLGQNRRVESAGICLAGTELDHNLSTIVLAMQEARRQRRFDLNEDLWI